MSVTVHQGDCLEVMRSLPDASVDAIVTDPPYGLGFMGKAWDDLPPSLPWAQECLRVLKPGGHLLAFGGTRTWHRLVVAVEDAGFEIRDSIAWLYGSGFPKSLDVSKAIDKAAGAEREVVGRHIQSAQVRKLGTTLKGSEDGSLAWQYDITAPATPDAERWQGWGTALKPAWENIVVGQKPADQWARIGSHLAALEDECRQSANCAARSSAPIPAASPEARTATAPASAATPHEDAPARTTPTGAADDSSAATDTSASESTDATCLSIVTSWRACWADLSSPTSTSTTGTTSSTTTDLTTLWSCLSRLTHPSTLLDPTSPDGLSSLARAADNLFAAAVLSSNATRTLTATEPATSPTPRPSQAAGGLEPIVVARKPLGGGTVAANVLAHGTGALNIDGCRIGTSDTLGRAKAGWLKGGYVGGESPQWDSRGVTVEGGRWPTNVVLDGHTADALDGVSRFFPTFRYQAKAPKRERPRYTRPKLRLREDLTPAQLDHVRARLAEAGVQVD